MWADRIGTFRCRCYERPANLDALLGRPNGYVAGAAEADDRDEESQSALSTALSDGLAPLRAEAEQEARRFSALSFDHRARGPHPVGVVEEEGWAVSRSTRF
jgi:hypothetical protein